MSKKEREMRKLSQEEAEQVAGGTFDDNKYKDHEYAYAEIKVVPHFFAKNEFWWNGTNIGHDNANAVVFFCQYHGGQPASLEEALRFKQDHTVKPENHGCDLLHLAS